MTEGSGSGSPLWVGVALVFVGMVGKDLFLADNGPITKETPTHKMENGNLVQFEYCYS